MPLISILIPTRNRPQLAALAVEAALAATDDECEIVVADNSDAPLDLPQADKRLQHLPPAGGLSMPDNWERALRAARGEWLMLLADKYMLVPGAIAALRGLATPPHRAVTYGYGVLRQSLGPGEDASSPALESRGGALQWPTQGEASVRDSRQALAEIYAGGGRYPREYPMLYTTLVHRSVVDEARGRTGDFFFGPCPDVASALQILAACDCFLATELPIVMVQYPSADPRWSTGASTLAGGEVASRFFSEIGTTEQDRVGRLVSGAIFETLREFARRRADLGPLVALDWPEFSKRASREIEAGPLAMRIGLQIALLRCTQGERLRAEAAFAQLRAALAAHLPRRLVSGLLDLRRRALPGVEAAEPLPAVQAREVPTRRAGLELLAEQLRTATAARWNAPVPS